MMLMAVIVTVGAWAQSEGTDTLTLKQRYVRFLLFSGDEIISPFVASKHKRVLYDEKNGIICTVEYYEDASEVGKAYRKELSRLRRNKTVLWGDDIREGYRQELMFDSCAAGLADVGNFVLVNVTDE